MHRLYKIRKLYGNTYVTVFPDDFVVPWRPLSIGDFMAYHHAYLRGVIPLSHLEDEIFNKCVVDDAIVAQAPFLKAGIVTTVSQHIWQHSGPRDVTHFNALSLIHI